MNVKTNTFMMSPSNVAACKSKRKRHVPAKSACQLAYPKMNQWIKYRWTQISKGQWKWKKGKVLNVDETKAIMDIRFVDGEVWHNLAIKLEVWRS